MRRTRVLRTAYNDGMEMLVVLVLLAYAEKDGEFKSKLLQVLAFYRENRALLMALSGEKRGEEECPAAEKNAPPATAGGESLHILEEFLKKV